MSFLSKDTQITPSGQAIKINSLASSALNQVFSPNIGPSGTLKMLITPSNTLSLTKDGTTICKEVQFTHPLSKILSTAALNISQSTFDGTSSFICFTCDLFNIAFRYYADGIPIHRICEGIQKACFDVMRIMDEMRIEITPDNTEEVVKKLAYAFLSTKIDSCVAESFSDYIYKAINTIEGSNDTNMIEILKMGEGDPEDSIFLNGLVLDHGNRHPQMPTKLENCAIMITNISLEYEKTEVDGQFVYSSAEQRDKLSVSERKFIFERVKLIADFAKKLKEKTGKNLVVINEKGIDPISLVVLAESNVLALRRAKRRNMERLVAMCGGNIISRVEQIDFENLGYAEKVEVVSFDDEKYTFIEGTPFKGSCTLLVKGNTTFEVERIVSAVKSTVKCINNVLKEKVYIHGGKNFYGKIHEFLNKRIKEVNEEEVIGYKVVTEGIINMAKTLIRNGGANVEKEIIRIERKEYTDEVNYDSFNVTKTIINNACLMVVNLLMVDDIIKAGKPLKEEKNKE